VTDKGEMFASLEAFVDDAVRTTGIGDPDSGDLARKIDVLERVVELMRLHSGAMENRLRMEELLSRGVEVSRGSDGALRLLLGGGAPTGKAIWPSPGGRTQTEMQVPLILFLLITYRRPRSINNLLVEFLGEARAWLSPSDVETTRTGVMRAMTTTRSAARALRLYGLLTDSDRTAYKTWELSVLGLLVGAVLLERVGPTLEMQARGLPISEGGRFGSSTHLARPVADVLRLFSDAREVSAVLRRICTPNREVLSTFDRAVEMVVAFVGRYDAEGKARGGEPHELRAEARTLIEALREAIPPDAFSGDMAKDVAMKELLGHL
jgi:hypothetical protein